MNARAALPYGIRLRFRFRFRFRFRHPVPASGSRPAFDTRSATAQALRVKLLVSPVHPDEVPALAALGVDVIDLKSVAEGSLGAPLPALARAALDRLGRGPWRTSLSLGDLPDKPATAALAALGAASLGVDDIKAGLFGATTRARAAAVLGAIRDALRLAASPPRIVAAAYGDYRSFGGLPPLDLVAAAAASGAAAVMLDTYVKDGTSLFDALPSDELRAFAGAARDARLEVGLSGALGWPDIARIRALRPDFVGIRGALCAGGDRAKPLDPDRVRLWVDTLRGCARDSDAAALQSARQPS